MQANDHDGGAARGTSFVVLLEINGRLSKIRGYASPFDRLLFSDRDVHRRDPQRPLHVDSGHPLGFQRGLRPALIEPISQQISIPKTAAFRDFGPISDSALKRSG
jgi:hypothetical protein